MKARSTLVKILPACSRFPCGRGRRLLPSKRVRSMMRSLFVAAVLAAVLPGSALGAGLVQQRDLQPQASRSRGLAPGTFELVGLHWRGSGRVEYRTRSLAGRWSRWLLSSDEDALPDRGRPSCARCAAGASASRSGRAPRTRSSTGRVGRVARVRAFFVRSPRLPVGGKRPELAGAPPIITRADWHADEAIRRAAPYYADGDPPRDRPPHGRLELLLEGAVGLDRARRSSSTTCRGTAGTTSATTSSSTSTARSSKAATAGSRRPVIGAHAQGFNSGSVGIARDRRLRLDLDLAGRAGGARLADRLAARPRSRRPALEGGARLGRQPALRGGHGGHAERDLRPPRRLPDELSRREPLRAAAVARAARSRRPGCRSSTRRRWSGALGGPVRFTRAALERCRVDGDRARRRRRDRRERHAARARRSTGPGTRPPRPAQHYTWSIAAPQMRPATGSIGSAPAPLALQQLKVAPAIVTPNGDGRGDEAKVTLRPLGRGDRDREGLELARPAGGDGLQRHRAPRASSS